MTAKVNYGRWIYANVEGHGEIDTIEFAHPDFQDSYRFVKGFSKFVANDESAVEKDFSPTSFIYESSGIRSDGDVSTVASFGTAARIIDDIYSQISDQNRVIPITMTFRRHYSGDTSEPVFVERTDVSDIKMSGFNNVSVHGEDTDFNNKPSGRLYRLKEYPLLEGFKL